MAAVDEHPGRRERKKLATRRAIASAAVRLAAERGPDAVTVDEISRAADVSPRTFFNYFPTKEDAVLGVDPDRAAEVRDRLLARPEDESPLDTLLATLTEASHTLTERAEEWTLRTRLVQEHPSLFPRYVAGFAALESELVAAVARRSGLDPATDLYPRLVVAAALAAMRVAVDHWQATRAVDPSASVEELLADAFGRLASGLTPPVPALAG
jgi:AcrR family transcriptional regulator